MLWVITCISTSNMEALRDKMRPSHHDYLKSRDDIIVLSGRAQSPDGGAIIGSVFVINVNSYSEAKAFSDGEPFTQAGVFSSITIQRMTKGHWNPKAAENA